MKERYLLMASLAALLMQWRISRALICVIYQTDGLYQTS